MLVGLAGVLASGRAVGWLAVGGVFGLAVRLGIGPSAGL